MLETFKSLNSIMIYHRKSFKDTKLDKMVEDEILVKNSRGWGTFPKKVFRKSGDTFSSLDNSQANYFFGYRREFNFFW